VIGRFFSSLVNNEAMGEEIIKANVKTYFQAKRQMPEGTSLDWLVAAYLGRVKARGEPINNSAVFDANYICTQFENLPEPQNARALGIAMLLHERSDIILECPKFLEELTSLTQQQDLSVSHWAHKPQPTGVNQHSEVRASVVQPEKPTDTRPLNAEAESSVKLSTNFGDIVIAVNFVKAPKTAQNFIGYVRDGFYDGTIFHRVMYGFMIQGGGLDIEMKQKSTRPPIINEANNGLKNNKYTVAIARASDPNSATSQFFINLAHNDFLNFTAPNEQGWGYAVFGEVVEGHDVVDRIAGVSTSTSGFHQNVPTVNVIISKATVIGASSLLSTERKTDTNVQVSSAHLKKQAHKWYRSEHGIGHKESELFLIFFELLREESPVPGYKVLNTYPRNFGQSVPKFIPDSEIETPTISGRTLNSGCPKCDRQIATKLDENMPLKCNICNLTWWQKR